MKKHMKTQLGRFVAGLIALLVVIAVSAGAQQMNFLKADVTPQKVMTMSETSLEIAKGIGKEVTISYIASDSGKELWVEELAMKYAAANDRIVYEQVALSGSRANQLAAKAGEALTENSLVVSCGDRATTIAQADLYSISYNQMYLYYYGEYVAEAQYFIADEQLANALIYVTSDDLPVVYELTGHGETAAGTYVRDQFAASSVILKTLSLKDAVPADAAAVMIIAPAADLSDQETAIMQEYLKNGGKLILATGYMMETMPNLEKLTSYYGMKQVPGVVLDVAGGYCYSTDYPQYLMPDALEHESVATLAGSGLKPTFPLAGALERSNISRNGLTVTELLTTSDTAYTKTSLQATTIEMEDGDASGRFTVAMAAEEGETRIVWYGSASFLTDNDIQISSGYNLYMLKDAMSWMMPLGEKVSIESQNLLSNTLAVPAEQTTAAIAVLFVPALLALVVGLIAKKKK